MKKTLIASTVLLASGAAFAQATITGSFTYGYKATTAGKANSPQAAGFGVDKSEVDISVKEDLGGGQTVKAKMAFAGLDRSGESTATTGNGNVSGRDASLTYTNNSVGQIEMGVSKPSNYFAGVATAGAPVIDFDEKLFQTETSNDYISYTVPVGPVYLQAKHDEPSGTKGLGRGSQGDAYGQRSTTLTAYYSEGPLTVLLGYVSYDNRRAGGLTSVALFQEYAAGTKDYVTNVQASYDLGMVKLGAGFQQANASNGVVVADALFGMSSSMGAWTFGATYAQSIASGAKDTSAFGWDLSKYNGTASGYSLGASYALSKRTSLTAKTARWTHSGYSQYEADGALSGASAGYGYNFAATQTTLLLSHSF